MRNIIFLLLYFCAFIFLGCNKDEFLSKKPSTDIVVPKTIEELQGLLENDAIITKTPVLWTLSADEYYHSTFQAWQSLLNEWERNAYIWAPDVYGGSTLIRDWNTLYTQVFWANIVLDGLSDIEINNNNRQQWNHAKGWALFVRGFAFYNLVETFSLPFDPTSADIDLGIPLRLRPEVNLIEQRSSVRQTYDQVIDDLNEASKLLLPAPTANYRHRPSKATTFALLSRVYLSVRNYAKAEAYADSSLSLYNSLLNYNTLSITATAPFNNENIEVLYRGLQNVGVATTAAATATVIIDSNLYNSYVANDLRKNLYFVINSASGKPNIKRGYYGNSASAFGGIATDEMYLIKAECLARRGIANESMIVLNSLLQMRWKTGTFVPYTASTSNQALTIVLAERRKELVWRGLRWLDLRRLNKEGANITLTRILNGETYTLPANSTKYVFPIPQYEIDLSGIQQNPPR